MKTLKINAILLFFFCANLHCLAQLDTVPNNNVKPKNKGFDSSKLFSGGNFGLSFGTITIIEISPLLGYQITDRVSVGLGVTYLHYSDNVNQYKTNVYGGRVFARYNLFPNLFLHAEAEELNGEWVYPDRWWELALPVGAGYRQPLGDFSSFTFMLLYNLNHTAYSPYQSPVIVRVGFNIGL